jgi:hypothetical protein
MTTIYVEEREMAASADTVFNVLTDFAQYAQWNPWVVRVEGQPIVGSELLATAKLNGALRRVHHRVLVAERARSFAWCDVGWFTALTYGERVRYLQPRADGGCHYRCELRLSGPLQALVAWWLGATMREGLRAEADALVGRAALVQQQS